MMLEMRVICRKSDMPVQAPFQHHLCLMAHVTALLVWPD